MLYSVLLHLTSSGVYHVYQSFYCFSWVPHSPPRVI